MKKIKTMNEFLASTETETKPATREPETAPAPVKPSPIRRGKPLPSPAPKAEVQDVINRFMYELKNRKGEKLKLNIKKIRSKYDK